MGLGGSKCPASHTASYGLRRFLLILGYHLPNSMDSRMFPTDVDGTNVTPLLRYKDSKHVLLFQDPPLLPPKCLYLLTLSHSSSIIHHLHLLHPPLILLFTWFHLSPASPLSSLHSDHLPSALSVPMQGPNSATTDATRPAEFLPLLICSL